MYAYECYEKLLGEIKQLMKREGVRGGHGTSPGEKGEGEGLGGEGQRRRGT